MATTDTHEDTDLSLLEETFEEDCKCEFQHWGEFPCSVKVTHRIHMKCRGSFLLCLNAAIRDLGILANSDLPCKCGRPVTVCWTVVPV